MSIRYKLNEGSEVHLMLGNRLRELRLSNHYTQDDLAEMLDVGANQINRYENNKTEPSGEVVARIAKLLNTSADYLLGLTDDPRPGAQTELSPQEWAIISALRRKDYKQVMKAIVADK